MQSGGGGALGKVSYEEQMLLFKTIILMLSEVKSLLLQQGWDLKDTFYLFILHFQAH